jgi:hypothetical protein
LEYPAEKISNCVRIDLTYLPRLHPPHFRYFEASSRHAAQLEEIADRMGMLQLKERKKYKEVEQDVLYELRQAREAASRNRDVLPSFLALQLKKYMNLDQSAQAPSKQQSKKGKERQQAKLGQQIKQFIGQIEDIVII